MNNISLIGRLASDPKLRYTKTDQTPYAYLTLAVDRNFSKDKEKKRTDFISCIVYRRTAEVVNEYAGKGSQVAIIGKLTTWNTNQMIGTEKVFHNHYQVEVSQLTLLGSKKENNHEALNASAKEIDDLIDKTYIADDEKVEKVDKSLNDIEF